MKTKYTHLFQYGSWALVSGASSGIGKTFCEELAAQGMNLVITGRKESTLMKLKQEWERSYKVKVQVRELDLTLNESIDRFFSSLKGLDIGLFIHSAGMESHGRFEQSSEEHEMELLQLNVASTLRLTRYFSDKLVKRGQGGILLVSSLASHFISPYFANYSASKAYINMLALSLREELRAKKVDVSVLAPGLTQTPMLDAVEKDIDWSKTPMKNMSTLEVVQTALEDFPRKGTIIPGKANRIVSFIGSRVMPEKFGRNNEKMMREAFRQIRG
ncbi:MAG: SDR family NAD(P)-dependent oxidoreductase [Bacteroidetes bacterium]|nr:SDR family NAD(P)-dependent oxidoreductase [Bacteroidota bacterium]